MRSTRKSGRGISSGVLLADFCRDGIDTWAKKTSGAHNKNSCCPARSWTAVSSQFLGVMILHARYTRNDVLFFYPSLITLIAVLSAAAGVWLTSYHGLSRRLVPFGGGVLLGVALFWVLPEMAEFFTWQGAILWLAGGFLLLAAVDRFVYPVCPACSPSHEHDHCATRLHGFATPLLAAAALHSALDGWSAAASQTAGFSMALHRGGSRCTRFPRDLRWASLGACFARHAGFRFGMVRASPDGDHRRRRS